MVGEWREVSLGDVSELVRGVSYRPNDLLSDGLNAVPLLRATNIGEGILDLSNVLHVPSTLVREAQYLRRFDVVLAMSSGSRQAVGRLAQLRRDWTGCVGAFCGVIRPNPQRIHPEYLGYVLHSPDFRTRIETYAVGTAIMNLSRERLLGFRFRLPGPAEQRAIAHILGTLDDKIELLRRMSETLEQMARAIFKSWFVDFDPVRAKAAVRREHPSWTNEQISRAACPNLKPEIAALFPDSFEDSELGQIPKGWRVGKLGDIVQIHDSKRVPLSSRERATRQGLYRYYGAAGIVDYVNDFLFDGIYVLVGEDGSVVTELGNPVVQYVWGKFWVNNHAHVLKASGGFSDEHLLLLLKQVYVVPFLTGAVQPKLSQANMNAIPIVRAETEVNAVFNTLIEPLFAKARTLHDEGGLLAALRDALLPRLISGELRVKDAERFLEEAVT